MQQQICTRTGFKQCCDVEESSFLLRIMPNMKISSIEEERSLSFMRASPAPHPPRHMRRDRELAFQVTMQIQPANKLESLVLRIGLVIGLSLIECFDSEEVSDLVSRKTRLL